MSRVAICEVRSKKKTTKNKLKKKYNDQQQKQMDCDEPHLTPNKKTEPIQPHLTMNKKTKPIQWTEQPTGALVATGSLWPSRRA